MVADAEKWTQLSFDNDKDQNGANHANGGWLNYHNYGILLKAK
jgi:hypothetical protein